MPRSSGRKSVTSSSLRFRVGLVRPSMVTVPSWGPALKVMVLSPGPSAGRGAWECWMSWTILSASRPVPLPLSSSLSR